MTQPMERKPKIRDFRARAIYKPQPDGTVKIELPKVEVIEREDIIRIDPIGN